MTQRILLADDSATIRKVVELTFSDEDFAIDSVGDGSQALEHARAQRPDIIISDVIMPGLNGYELCQQCKSDPGLRSVPFLFLKGTFESFDEDKARSCGADGFIVKPFESQEMIAKVKDLIVSGAAAPAPAPQPAPVAEQPVRTAIPTPGAVPPVAPRPLSQPPPAAAPPPIPTSPPRPAPAPPALPVMPPRPGPPLPQWPTRQLPVAPAAAPAPPQPLKPTPAVYQPPPPPTPTPTPAAAVQSPGDEFGFDFGDADDNRSGAPAEPTPVSAGTAPAPETSGESDEDLWSEVSLRSGTGGPGADIFDLSEESALHAPEVLFEDEAVFEEISTARIAPEAPVVESPEEPEEAPPAPAPSPSAVPAAPAAIGQDEIDRIVSARVEAAVRQVLEPIVGDLARTMIESIAWEVIPDLAEAMIRAEIERVRQSARND